MTTDATLVATRTELTPDYDFATCVTADGEVMFWLVARTDLPVPFGCACPRCTPHEQTGPLNNDWKRRVGLQCAASSSQTGRQCRNTVTDFGAVCHAHKPTTKISSRNTPK
jgi:hypothetical protein